jgi:hypothetical protein
MDDTPVKQEMMYDEYGGFRWASETYQVSTHSCD